MVLVWLLLLTCVNLVVLFGLILLNCLLVSCCCLVYGWCARNLRFCLCGWIVGIEFVCVVVES